MGICPVCNARVADDFGLIECENCNAQLIVHVDGRVEYSGGQEASHVAPPEDLGDLPELPENLTPEPESLPDVEENPIHHFASEAVAESQPEEPPPLEPPPIPPADEPQTEEPPAAEPPAEAAAFD